MTAPNRAQIGLLVDSPYISRWQAEALRLTQDVAEVRVVLLCENSRVHRSVRRNFLYYVLNIFSIRNNQNVAIPWSEVVGDDCAVIRFSCEYDGSWQVIDEGVSEQTAGLNLDVIVRFGMNLIKNPASLPAKHGILSFHHGDPRSFRGRPAGFYEVLKDVDAVGVIVQELSPRLDSGRVFAFGRYRLTRHSYRRTLEHVFAQGSALLRLAIMNCQSGESIELGEPGRVFRLPSNSVVMRFFTVLLWRKFLRLLFGLFFHRKWGVSWTSFPIDGELPEHMSLTDLRSVKKPVGVTFVADPFILGNETFVCEAMPKGGFRGVLMIHDGRNWSELDTSFLGQSHHLSFPFVFEADDCTYILPEMAQHGHQSLWLMNEKNCVVRSHKLNGLAGHRLIDPVLMRSGHLWWLFAGLLGNESDHLYLWSSTSLEGNFEFHPKNPIVIDPSRARNAGGFIAVNGDLYRLGQNNCREYGDGISVCRVNVLDETSYSEEVVSSIKTKGFQGPHTLHTRGEIAIVDHYSTSWDLLAWLPRLKKLWP